MICLHVILSLVAKINCYFRSDGPFINSFTSPTRYCNNVDNWTVCVHGNVAQLMVVYHRLYLKPAPVRDSFFRFSVCSAPEKSLFLFCRGILVTSHHDSPANGQAVIFLTGLLEVLVVYFLINNFGNSIGQLCPLSSRQCSQKYQKEKR